MLIALTESPTTIWLPHCLQVDEFFLKKGFGLHVQHDVTLGHALQVEQRSPKLKQTIWIVFHLQHFAFSGLGHIGS